jgi:serine/threonine-protein kinase
MNDSLVGTTLGQYELVAPLGQGGMASVYRGFQPSLNRSVAVKVLPLARIPDPTLPARFRREALMAASLLHPNVVPVYDFGEWEGHLYIVMALVAGGTLKERATAPLPVDAAVRLVGQVADALGFAHAQGIFHRDVKPTNVLLERADWAMLGDFGIARALGDMTGLTSPFGTIGTPAYMAPEQWLGGEIDGRADLYALGAVLYQLLTGTVPFTATTAPALMRQHLEAPVPPLSAHRGGLPRGFEDVIQTALAKQPEARYQYAAELKAALEAARGGRTPDPPSRTLPAAMDHRADTGPFLGQTLRVPMTSRTIEQPSRHAGTGRAIPILIALVIVLVTLLAGTVGYIVAGGRLDPTPRSATPTQQPVAAQPSVTILPTAALQAPAPAPPTATAPPPTQPVPPTQAAPALIEPTTEPAMPTAPPPTAAPPTVAPPTAVPPTPALKPTAAPKPTVAQPAAPAKPSAAVDRRFGLIERHVSDYFAALNAGDHARALQVCCTAGFRARNPLDQWRRNFTGVTDLQFTTPFRYPTVEPDRIIAEVDYSFLNSTGTRQFFTLRWTFVPGGNDWLADDATAARRR